MLSFQLSAQVKSIDFEKELTVDKKSGHRHYGEYFKRADNEVEMLYTGAFVFYKSFISSHDGSTCWAIRICFVHMFFNTQTDVLCVEEHLVIDGEVVRSGPVWLVDSRSTCQTLEKHVNAIKMRTMHENIN